MFWGIDMRLWLHGALVDQDSERHGLFHWLVCQKHEGCCSVPNVCSRGLYTSVVAALCDDVLSLLLDGV